MHVRRARPDEAGDISSLWLRSRAACAPAIPPPVHTDDEVRAWFRDVVLPTMEVWVVVVDGSVTGMLVLEGDWIEQLYVDPAHTGRSLGTRLVTVAKRQRPNGLKLWTFQANEGARRFYERHGFVAREATDGDNEEGAPDVRYQWLPPPAPKVP